MGIADILACTILIILSLRGAWRGFSGEIGSLLGMLAAGVALYFGMPAVSATVGHFLQSSAGALFYLVNYGSLMLLFIVIWGVVRGVLKSSLKVALGQPFDALGGMLVGLCEAAVLILIMRRVTG